MSIRITQEALQIPNIWPLSLERDITGPGEPSVGQVFLF